MCRLMGKKWCRCGVLGELGADEFSAEGDLDSVDDGTRWEVEHIGEIDAGLEADVVDNAGAGIVEMAVLAEVRAVARRFAVEVDLADDAMLHECFEAVVNRGERDIWQAIFDPHEDIVGGRVVPLLLENAVNLLPLAGHAEARNFLRNLDFFRVFCVFADHGGGKLLANASQSRIIPIIISG